MLKNIKVEKQDPLIKSMEVSKLLKNILENKNDDYITCWEEIDVDKLNFIVENKNKFEHQITKKKSEKFDSEREELLNIDPFLVAEKYLDRSRKGNVSVFYK